MMFFKQKTNATCAAAAYRMAVSPWEIISEKTAVDEVKTTCQGTFISNVLNALNKRNINCHFINLNVEFKDYFHWMDLTSRQSILCLSCEYIDNYNRRGRDSHRHHAIVAYKGTIFDPGEDKPCPVEAYFDSYHKKLFIKSMILIEVN